MTTPQQSVTHCYTVFYNPIDFPGLFVVRCFEASAEGIKAHGLAYSGKTLEEVRAKIPAGLWCVPRSAQDHPSVVESWI
jgi:hypothetical protein